MTSTNHVPTDLMQALDPTPDHLRVLHDRLAGAAQDAAVLDLAYRTVDSPIGALLVAATELGVVRLAFAGEDHDAVLQTLADRISPRVLRAPQRLDGVARELDEYFAGRRRAFDVALDWRLAAGFRTATYAAVAQRAGNPRAVRAVGSACATNPLPVLVPCHRVVRSDGGMGGYLGGVEAKRTLLTLEAAAA
jgi:methylated-DNA-[protein]-cysteine S-methyltransferase